MGESQLFEIGLETDPNLGSRSQTPRAGLACVSLGGFGFPLLERVLTPASNPWVSRKTESKGAKVGVGGSNPGFQSPHSWR